MVDRLGPVSRDVLLALEDAQSDVVRTVVQRAVARTAALAGDSVDGRVISQGMTFVLRMLSAAMGVGAIALLDDELSWGWDRLPHDGVSPEHVLANFGLLRQVLDERLAPQHAAAIAPYVEWMITRQAEMIQNAADS